MIALLALMLTLQQDYVGPASGSISDAEAKQVVDDSARVCPELMRHDQQWDPVPYLRRVAAAGRYTQDQQYLLTSLCDRYVNGWSAALVDHQARRERRPQR